MAKVEPAPMRIGQAARWQAALYQDDNGHWFASVQCIRDDGAQISRCTATYETALEALNAAPLALSPLG